MPGQFAGDCPGIGRAVYHLMFEGIFGITAQSFNRDS